MKEISQDEFTPNIMKLEQLLCYKFSNRDLILTALTHTSYANEHYQKSGVPIEHNERMEFLGDSILSASVSSYIYSNYSHFPEGQLSKLRAALVCESSLAEFARRLELNKYIRLGVGEKSTGGHDKTSILSDAFESIIGAVFLDAGYEKASNFVISNMKNDITLKIMSYSTTDYKSNLQEMVQKEGKHQIKYEIISSEGPCHDKTYIAKVTISDGREGIGEGKSKKDAEQIAAKNLLGSEGK